MKKVFLALTVMTLLVSCGGNTEKESTTNDATTSVATDSGTASDDVEPVDSTATQNVEPIKGK